MATRLSKIATRTGDDGTTGLGDGSRTTKDALRVQAMGDVDELNSNLCLLLCEDMPDALREELITIQHDLFDLGGEICIPGFSLLTDEHVLRLDNLLVKYNSTLPVLAEFILPAGSRAASQAHVCRTVCRRAERAIVALGLVEMLHPQPRQYVNRLSDLLFVIARVLNRFADGTDVMWQKGRDRSVS
jgi:cob(I)alamin adenosyltransferase